MFVPNQKHISKAQKTEGIIYENVPFCYLFCFSIGNNAAALAWPQTMYRISIYIDGMDKELSPGVDLNINI